MNAHPVSEEQLMAYLDGEAPAESAVFIAFHLDTCPACRQFVAELHSVSRQLRRWTVEAPSFALAPNTENPRAPVAWYKNRWLLAFPAGLAALYAISLFVPAPKPMKRFDRLPASAQRSELSSRALLSQEMAADSQPATLNIFTAEVTLTTSSFDTVRPQLDRLLAAANGHIALWNESSAPDRGRHLTASLRVPAANLSNALAALRKLGRIENETRRTDEVTATFTDTQARLANAQRTEQRLLHILRTRTAKLSDILELEQHLSRVRADIESMQAAQKNLANRIDLATVELRVDEDYLPVLIDARSPFPSRIRNAFIVGMKDAANRVLALALWLLEIGPTLLFVALLLFFPARSLWCRRNTYF